MLEDGRVVLTVGDVVGHGLEAAAAMGQLRTAVSALAGRCSPGEILVQLDAFLARSHVTNFATVCVAVYNPTTGTLEYASAGHPPMLAISHNGDVLRLDQGQSMPLFGGTSQTRQEAQITLDTATVLILYSDGLVERRGESLDHGLERLEAAARAAAESPVDDICLALLHDLDVEGSSDDVVVVAARLTRVR